MWAAIGRDPGRSRIDVVHPGDLGGPARYHRQFGVKSLEVELAHDAVAGLLHQKHPRAGLEPMFQQTEFLSGEAETLHVLRRFASALGKKTLVGVCSTRVRLMGLSRTSLALCVARHITAFNLRQVLGPSLANFSKAGSASSRQNSSIQQTSRRHRASGAPDGTDRP